MSLEKNKIIAILGRGKSLKYYSKYSHLFKKIYIVNTFKKEINRIGMKYFEDKEVIQVIGRGSVQLLLEQYKKLNIKDIYLTSYKIIQFKTGSGKKLKNKYPKFIKLNVVPEYMQNRDFPWADWGEIWKYAQKSNDHKSICDVIKKKFHKDLKKREKTKEVFSRRWPTAGNYAIDLALNQNKKIDSLYLFGFDFYTTLYFTPIQRDHKVLFDTPGTQMMKWHIGKLVREFNNINFYTSSNSLCLDCFNWNRLRK